MIVRSIARWTGGWTQRRAYCQVTKQNPIQQHNLAKRSIKKNPFRYLIYLVPITTFGLGTWQVQRRKQKLQLIELLEQRLTSEPVELPTDLRELPNFEYNRFILHGTFDHSKEIIVQPRARLDKTKRTGGGLISGRNLQNGAWIITPLQLTGRNYSVLVNRGWVPKHKIEQSKRPESLVQGEVKLIGILRLTEKRGQFQMKNQPNHDIWTYRDVDAMAFSRGAAPVFLDATRDYETEGGPIGGQTQVTIRNEHLNYIVTWYSLSLLTFLLARKALAK